MSQTQLAPLQTDFVGLSSPTSAPAGTGCNPCQGLYWTRQGERPRVAVIATHYNLDFAELYIAPYLARRGVGFLGWNTRFRGLEDQFILEHALIDIGAGVRWLREQANVETIVILGNSGGCSLMAAYQAAACAGWDVAADASPAVHQALAGLIAGNLFITLNGHSGRPEILTNWMDASVVDESDPTLTDHALDPFSPANGPPYTAEFITRYRAAQGARNQRITDWAKEELSRLHTAGIPDRIFPLFRTWADLRFMDETMDPSDRQPRMCYAGFPPVANRGFRGLGRTSSLTTWLSMWSLETSRCIAAPHLACLNVPALVIQGLADTGVFPSDARAIHAAIGSSDKTLELMPGAHYFEDATGLRDRVADFIVDWIGVRSSEI